MIKNINEQATLRFQIFGESSLFIIYYQASYMLSTLKTL